jgi:hypothetical protein
MKHLIFYETFTNKVIIGIDIDGTINDFFNGYNLLYKKYFPDKEIPDVDDWYWYKKLDYNGIDGRKWFNEHKAEVFEISQPYPGAVDTINNIYELIKSYGFTLNIVTNQPTEDSKVAAQKWLQKYGFQYDNLIFSETSKDKWKYADIMVDDADKVIGVKPLSKVSIKIEQPYNTNTESDFNIPNIKSLNIALIKQAVSKLKNNTTI